MIINSTRSSTNYCFVSTTLPTTKQHKDHGLIFLRKRSYRQDFYLPLNMLRRADVVIVGGGMAGLSAAATLQKHNIDYCLLEANNYLGGKVATHHLNGFLLDHGFQVFIEGYSEAKELINYDSLSLHSFEPGAIVRLQDKFHLVSDPFRRPLSAVNGLFTPIGSVLDKIKIAWLRNKLLFMNWKNATRKSKTFLSTADYLKSKGFSSCIIESFFRPFLRGIFLAELEEQYFEDFEFVFSMFASSNASLPAEGMQSIPNQIASKLHSEAIHLEKSVQKVQDLHLYLVNGEEWITKKIIIATDGTSASSLFSTPLYPAHYLSSCCLYFSSTSPVPVGSRHLILNGNWQQSLINNLCFPNMIAPTYAPKGHNLISVTLHSWQGQSLEKLVCQVKDELKLWFGNDSVEEWNFLQHYIIKNALPSRAVRYFPYVIKTRVDDDTFLCGDYCDSPTLNGALASGKHAAMECYLFFIRHLSEFCDSIVLLDDHSQDQTVLETQLLSRYFPIEGLLYFSNQWDKRDELRDRKLLLAAGRQLRATHFVFIDYDEVFAADCIHSGQLRQQILKLSKGQALQLQWIFPWNGTLLYATLPRCKSNLLNRSSPIVFADHEQLTFFEYRTLKNNTTMHVPRCPRFHNGSFPLAFDSSCKILDLRFLSFKNLQIKLLWYDALGRILNDSKQVRGKVFQLKMEQIRLYAMPQDWLNFTYFDERIYQDAETWRLQQIIQWKKQYTECFVEECSDCTVVCPRNKKKEIRHG
eukprot:jgi/Galph1/3822/GphlegSOOS_G2468.1